jgi:hypothetical protein
MCDINADGCLSTNAKYQQLEMRLARSLVPPALEQPVRDPLKRPSKNNASLKPLSFIYAGQDAHQGQSSSLWPVWWWPTGDYVCVHDEHDMHIL